MYSNLYVYTSQVVEGKQLSEGLFEIFAEILKSLYLKFVITWGCEEDRMTESVKKWD